MGKISKRTPSRMIKKKSFHAIKVHKYYYSLFFILGVFTGYNLLSVALTLPKDGKVIGCDVSSEYFDIGRPLLEEV